MFFVGLLPAAVTLWIRRGVQESPLWTAQHRAPEIHRPSETAPSGRMLDTRYRGKIIITLLMNAAALFAWWGLFTWIPPYLALPVAQGGRGMSVAASSAWIVVMQVGMWLGYVSFGFVSDALGPKKTYVGYLLVAAGLVPLYSRAGAASLLALGPLVAFFGTGHFTGFGILTAELFPTSFRASAMGLTYNFGRALSAAAPWAIGALAGRHGLSSAFWISGLAFFVAALLAMALPVSTDPRLA